MAAAARTQLVHYELMYDLSHQTLPDAHFCDGLPTDVVVVVVVSARRTNATKDKEICQPCCNRTHSSQNEKSLLTEVT